MIRHLVLVRFASRTPPSEIAAVLDQLGQLKGIVPGLLAFGAGPNRSPEGLSRGYTHAFSVDFADESARDAYLVHPAHKEAGARLVDAAEGGVDGLAVIDFAIDEG
jgi:hypothetical protein